MAATVCTMRMFVVVLVLVLVLVLVATCKKEARRQTNLPTGVSQSQFNKNRQAIDAAPVPAWFQHIPSDTPYLISALVHQDRQTQESLVELLAAMAQWDCATLKMRAGDSQCPATLPARIGCEHLSPEKMTAMGLGASPRFAIYGVGLVVATRFDVQDQSKVVDTVKDYSEMLIAAGFGLGYEKHGGVHLWETTQEHAGWYAALTVFPDHVAFLGSPWSVREHAKIHALGKDGLGRGHTKGVAKATKLKRIAKKYGYAPNLIAFVDMARLAKSLLGDSWQARASRQIWKDSSGTCSTSLEQWSHIVPTMSAGLLSATGDNIAYRIDMAGASQLWKGVQPASEQVLEFSDASSKDVIVDMALSASPRAFQPALEYLAKNAPTAECPDLPRRQDFQRLVPFAGLSPTWKEAYVALLQGTADDEVVAGVNTADMKTLLTRLMLKDYPIDGKFHQASFFGDIVFMRANPDSLRIGSTPDRQKNAETLVTRAAKYPGTIAKIRLNGKAMRNMGTPFNPFNEYPWAWLASAVDDHVSTLVISSDGLTVFSELSIATPSK